MHAKMIWFLINILVTVGLKKCLSMLAKVYVHVPGQD